MSDKMSCGHEYRYISRSNERTNFCVWCEWQATVAALEQAQAERDACRDAMIAANDAADLLKSDLAQAQAERDAAMIEVNDLRMSGSLLANQMVCACGGNLSKLLGCLECGTRYELISSDQFKRITDKLRVYEIASENAPPFSASSFEAVSYAIAERDAATRRAEQAEAVLSEQADIITANLWHIPPEYAARNILLDVAMKMRSALAGPEGGPR